MAIPASGPLALTDIQTEFGGANPISLSEYYAGGAYVPAGTSGTYGAVPSSGAISIQNFYGTSKPAPAGQAEYTAAGTYSWTAPAGVTSVSVVVVAGGGSGSIDKFHGAALSYKNCITVSPGSSYTVVVSSPTSACGSYFCSTTVVRAAGRTTRTGTGGGCGGLGSGCTPYNPGGGAGGYSGNGGNAGYTTGNCGSGGGGGGSARGGGAGAAGGGGGGVGLLGQGSNGAGGVTLSTPYPWTVGSGGGGGSGGESGTNGFMISCNQGYGGRGGNYGGGAGSGGNVCTGGCPISQDRGLAAVRIIWAGGSGLTRAFPSTNTGNL